MRSVYIRSGLHEIHARLRGQKSLLNLYQIIHVNKPDFPSLADEIAEPRPYMNIQVAAFTVSEKSINTCISYHRYVGLLQEMNLFHDLLREYNMTLVTSAILTPNSDIKVLISRFLVSIISSQSK